MHCARTRPRDSACLQVGHGNCLYPLGGTPVYHATKQLGKHT